MKQKVIFGLLIIYCLSGCTVAVTQKGFDSFGADIYRNFVYYVSKDLVLRATIENAVSGDHVSVDNSGKIILTNREIILTRGTRGRIENVTSTRFDVAFEELPGGERPYLTFIQNPKDSKKRYFLDTSNVRVVDFVDEKGEYGFSSTKGPVVPYDDRKYLALYNGEEPPYLIQVLDIAVRTESRKMRGLRNR